MRLLATADRPRARARQTGAMRRMGPMGLIGLMGPGHRLRTAPVGRSHVRGVHCYNSLADSRQFGPGETRPYRAIRRRPS
jgi:hypothetical protein